MANMDDTHSGLIVNTIEIKLQMIAWYVYNCFHNDYK